MKNKSKEYKNPDGEITDYFGFPLRIGDIVIHAYRGKTYEVFGVAIYIKENENSITIAKERNIWDYKKQVMNKVVRKSTIGKEACLMQPVIIVSNPLFCMNNVKIVKALELIDALKSSGDLPKDFQAGHNSENYLNGENCGS